MKIKDDVYDCGCPKCGAGKKRIAKAVYGCDHCKKEISSPFETERSYLEASFFYKEKDAAHLHFCSWECVFEFMEKLQKTKYKCDNFIVLPYIVFDGDKPGFKEFTKALRGARRSLRSAPVQQTTAKGTPRRKAAAASV